MHQRKNETSCESVAGDESYSRHRKCQNATPHGIERAFKVPRCGSGVFDVHAIGVEFGACGGCDDYAGGMAVFDYVEGEDEGVAEGLFVSGQIAVRGMGDGERLYDLHF